MKVVLNATGRWLGLFGSSQFNLVHALVVCTVSAAALFSSTPTRAVVQDPVDTTPPKSYFEQGILARSGETIDGLGPNLMGDQVNEYSGDLSFTQVDVSLPGNFALPVQVARHRSASAVQAASAGGLFGDWDLDIPHLYSVAAAPQPNWYGGGSPTNLNRCSQFLEPPYTGISTYYGVMNYFARTFWDGYHLHVPAKGDQTLLLRSASNPIAPSAGAAAYPVVTKEHWQLSCLSTLDTGADGEGFLALSPDGVKYRFDHLVIRSWPLVRVTWGAGTSTGTVSGGGEIQRVQVLMLPTLVTDRFGNWVRYNYAGPGSQRITSIESSDQRTITFAYSGSGDRVQSIFDGTRTWSYSYFSQGSLQTVTQPDASQWQFSLYSMSPEPFSSPDPACDGWDTTLDNSQRTWTMTHPSGAVGTFNVITTAHGRSNVPGSNACGFNTNPTSTYFASRSLTSKTLSGPGMASMTWSYAYSPAVGSFAPCNGCVNTKTVTITDPMGNVTVNTYGTQFNVNDGLLLQSAEGVVNGTASKTTTYEYRSPSGDLGGTTAPADTMSRKLVPLSKRTVSQDGVVFTHDASCGSCIDLYAREVAWVGSSSLGYSRAESTTLFDQTSLWVLGQLSSHTIAGVVAKSVDYNQATAQPTALYKFGKLQATYAFNADGTMSSVKDGLNQTTTFRNYARGLPQNIDYADGTGISAVVNNIGTLNSVTNEVNSTWRFAYDLAGRLSRKTPPAGYNETFLSFVQVPSDEYGIGANHWRQTITTGNAVTVNVFDARWRKRVSLTYDAADQANTQRMQRFMYDPYNRTTSAAYPARSLPTIDSYAGTSTVYDALGRVIRTISDSELGSLTTTTDYLSGFAKRYTDARGNVTTTSFQAFDEPSESAIISVAAPEGLNVTINRDVFGKPTAITRTGTSPAVSATRSYVYDANQLLCKTIEPEIGATVQGLDAANNTAWRATGLNLPSPSSCDYAGVPSAKMVAYTYDARNRLTNTAFGDVSPAIGRSYTPDGLPLTVVSNGSTWTYGYNGRRLLTSESLAAASTYNIGRDYDANANLSQLTYPDGTSVAFAPNALGEPTQAGGYATGVSYHPNGQVAGYTLGNGTVHALTQNVRGLPSVNSDAGILQDQYTYDANGNIVGIADQQEGISTRGMSYDGLDRLKTANAPAVWGTASYTYDALDNMLTSQVGNRNSVHSYWNNRLDTITTNGTATAYVYDSQGNVTARGTQGFYFDQGNRMQLANGVASYTYDGLGRRVGIAANDGTYRTQVYSQAGQLLYGTRQNGATSQTTKYVYLGGKTIAEVNGNTEPTYLHTDALGSPVATVGTLPAALSYSCASGWTLSGSTCTQATSSTIAATVTGYNCPAGYTLSGSTCSQTTTATSAATPNYSCSAGWSLSGSTCSLTTSNAATPIYACPSGFSLSGSTCSGTSTTAASVSWNCNGYGSLQPMAASPSGYYCTTRTVNAQAYDACPDFAASYGLVYLTFKKNGTNTVACYYGPVPVYSCPAGATLSGSNCIAPVTQAASVSGYTCSSGTLSGSSCLSTSTAAASVSYSCAPGQTLSGTTCSSSSTASTAGTPIYGCPANYTLAGTSCTTQGTASVAATPNYSCASGTLSGFNCLGALTRTRYEAYGNTAAGRVPTGIGFTGHVNDADTGLVYMQQRYYDPIAGRFLSVDPITTDANTGKGFNVYEYAQSNPYRFTDPDGRQACSGAKCFIDRPPGSGGPYGGPSGTMPLFGGVSTPPTPSPQTSDSSQSSSGSTATGNELPPNAWGGKLSPLQLPQIGEKYSSINFSLTRTDSPKSSGLAEVNQVGTIQFLLPATTAYLVRTPIGGSPKGQLDYASFAASDRQLAAVLMRIEVGSLNPFLNIIPMQGIPTNLAIDKIYDLTHPPTTAP